MIIMLTKKKTHDVTWLDAHVHKNEKCKNDFTDISIQKKQGYYVL